MDLYGRLVDSVLFPLFETRLRGRATIARRRELERTQWLPREALVAIQEAALARLVAHAHAHVPYYREIMQARGIDPREIRSLADLARLPVLDRDAARREPERRMSQGPSRPTLRKTTGGTTGQPLTFGYDQASEDWRQGVKLRGWGWAGYHVGARTVYYWGGASAQRPPLARRVKMWLDHASKREHYLDCTLRGAAELEATRQAMARIRPEVFIGYTQAMVDLARHVVATGRREWPDMVVLCSAEKLYPEDRPILAEAFGPAVFESYGCREVMLIGMECDRHDGMHVPMENLVVELLVTEADGTRRPAHPGEMGEVVVTDLHNLGMPFIRYATGDLAVAKPPATCACGRQLDRLASVEGRVAETVYAGDGSPVCGIFFSRIFSTSEALARDVRHWQVVQRPDRSLTVRLELAGPLSAEAESDLAGSFRAYLKGLPFRTEVVDEIPPGKNGKRQTVLCELPREARTFPARAATAT